MWPLGYLISNKTLHKSVHWVALNWVALNCRVPVNFFKWGVIKTMRVTHMSRQQKPFGSHVHTFNYFVISCPILRSFSFLIFGNKFRLKITKHALE